MKCFLFIALMVIGLNCEAENSEDDLHHWESYKIGHVKDYKDVKEEQLRKANFFHNLNFVREHNAKYESGEATFEVAINRFADLAEKEYNKLLNGFKSSGTLRRKGKIFDDSEDEELPESIDWRAEGAVTEVKDQGACGSCWAFSATGALEGQTFVAKKELVSLSEQNLVDCSTKGGNSGCNGGLMNQAFLYIKKNEGIDTEESYPYEAKKGKCRYKAENKGATDSGFIVIPSGSESMLKRAVALKGPIAIAINAGHMSFQLYKSGVYKWPKCGNKPKNLNHGVLLVGYGTTEAGRDYWLIKNSWGINWGMEGYMMLARNHDNMCGVATLASFPVV